MEGSAVIKGLWARVQSHRIWLLGSALGAAVYAAMSVQALSLFQKFQDEALQKKNWHLTVFYCSLIVAVIFIRSVADYFHRTLLRIAVERTVRQMRNEVFDRFLIFSQEQLSRYTSGKAVNHVVNDITVMSMAVHVLADVIREPLMLIGLLGYLFYLNWKLTVVCFIALPFIGLISKSLGASARRNQGRLQACMERLTVHIIESVGGLKTAQAFGQTPALRREFRHHTDEGYKHLVKLARIEEIISPATDVFIVCVGAGLAGFGGYLVVNGGEKFLTGELITFFMTAGMIVQPIKQLNQVNVRLQQTIAAGRRVLQVVNEKLDPLADAQEKLLEAGEAPNVLPPPPLAPTLEFRELSFRYPEQAFESGSRVGSRGWALQDVTLKLDVGKRLALVGRSGSGKSTLSMLALRFLDPSKGKVLLGGKSSSDWNLSDYRRNFAWVSQDVYLFDKSVRDNLAFARPGASDQEIWHALEKASVADLVKKLPEGLGTRLGEHGGRFSGGERQRLAIARAFLRNAPILILDEATSQLDAHNEKAVQTAMIELMEKRSVLLIAHRLSTIREVDEVAVFDEGRVLELGPPEILLDLPDGHFRKLWETQHA